MLVEVGKRVLLSEFKLVKDKNVSEIKKLVVASIELLEVNPGSAFEVNASDDEVLVGAMSELL